MNPAGLPTVNLRLRPPRRSERTAFWRLYKRCFQPLIIRQFGGWSDIEHARLFLAIWSGTTLRGIYYDGVIVGCVEFVRKSGHFELKWLQIDPDYQHLGIGTSLLDHLMGVARRRGLPIRLNVHTSNRAIRLYRRLGFRKISEPPHQYRMEWPSARQLKERAMIEWRRHHERGHANHGWLDSWHSFSFADYFDPAWMGVSDLRVINDDRIAPAGGFPRHPHRDMEIITYLLEGAVSHRDSMGNETTIERGEVQRMRAGRGVSHSEFNHSDSEPLHLLQIWVIPRENGLEPDYQQATFSDQAKRGRLLPIVTPDGRDGSLTIAQQASLYATLLAGGEQVSHQLESGRLAYIHLARGSLTLNGEPMSAGDGAIIRSGSLELAGDESGESGEALLFDLRSAG